VKYAWIARHKALWPVTLACARCWGSPRAAEHWRRKDADKPSRPGANKRTSDEALLVHIKAIHAEVKQEYGWPKMWKCPSRYRRERRNSQGAAVQPRIAHVHS
jgi:putative transposase